MANATSSSVNCRPQTEVLNSGVFGALKVWKSVSMVDAMEGMKCYEASLQSSLAA
jgi:hypothetical protein